MITAKIAPDGAANGLNLTSFLGFQAARLPILTLNRLIHLLAVYADLDWRGYAQSDLITTNVHHGNDDVIADDDTFVSVT
jgi:hypothetical protein